MAGGLGQTVLVIIYNYEAMMMEAVDSNYCGGREVGAVWAMLGPTKTLFIQIICSLSQDVYFVSAVFVFDQTSSASAAAR